MKILFLLSFAALLVLKTGAKPNPRIIGGANAADGQFPFAAAIHVRTPYNTFFCGGSLIVDRWVLTSGHCVYTATLLVVQLGSVSLTESDPNRVTVSSSEYFVHPEFNPETFQNDVALIKLRVNVTQHDGIAAVRIYPEELLNDVSLVVLGWGQTSDSKSELSEYLQYVEVVNLSNKECQLFYGDTITDSMICAAGSFNEGTCVGDTGGPLLYYFDDMYCIVGVASFVSSNGCENNQPSGFSRYWNYSEWIVKTVTTYG